MIKKAVEEPGDTIMLQAYNYNTGSKISIMEGAKGWRLLSQADDGAASDQEGFEEEVVEQEGVEPEPAAILEAGIDFVCPSTTSCTPVSEVAGATFQELQAAINRASLQFFDAGQEPIATDGVINPDTLVAAWRMARYLGPEASPYLADIGAVDIFDPAQVSMLSNTLASNAIGIKDAFDQITIAAAIEEERERKRVAWRRGWLAALAIVTSIGAATGAVLYKRRMEG